MMKKLLLGSTALAVGGLMAAPAMAADPIKMGVGGYYQFYALAGGMEGNYALNGTSLQFKGLQFIQEGEIHFIGQSKLDNGTTVGVRVELEGWNPSAGSPGAVHTIDEAYIFAFGDWGRMEFGAKDSAPYVMYYGAPSALLGFGFVQHNSNFSWTNPTANANNLAATHIAASTIDSQYQDVNRVNYYTPRFMGLQVGVSYTPKIQLAAGSQWGLATGPGTAGLPAGICGFADATTANGCPTNDNTWQDGLHIGANYLNKFGDVSVAVYGAYSYMSFVPSLNPLSNSQNTINGANLTSWKQAVVGLQFSFAGFTVGGSYGWDNNGLGQNGYTGVDNDTRTWAAGIMYETGPWQLSVAGVIATNDNGNGIQSISSCTMGTTSACSLAAASTATAYFGTNQNTGAASFGTVQATKIEVGANYALGPGIKLTGGAIFNNLSGPSNAVAGQSWAALLGMDFRF
jgi:porin-like protein